jgi:hypothetical protein
MADSPEAAMTSWRTGIRPARSIALSAAAISAVLMYGPAAEDASWALPVAVAAALGLHVLGLCSAMSLGADRHDNE